MPNFIINDFIRSKVASTSAGYFMLEDGLILQWGTFNGSALADGTVLNFPMTFPNACVSVVGSEPVPAYVGPHIQAKTRNSFTFICTGYSGSALRGQLEFNWIALGY